MTYRGVLTAAASASAVPVAVIGTDRGGTSRVTAAALRGMRGAQESWNGTPSRR